MLELRSEVITTVFCCEVCTTNRNELHPQVTNEVELNRQYIGNRI